MSKSVNSTCHWSKHRRESMKSCLRTLLHVPGRLDRRFGEYRGRDAPIPCYLEAEVASRGWPDQHAACASHRTRSQPLGRSVVKAPQMEQLLVRATCQQVCRNWSRLQHKLSVGD